MAFQRSIFRSEAMTLCDFFIQPEAAYTCLALLGDLKVVQFRDLNESVTAFQRKYTNDIRKCDEMERICRYVEKEICSHDRIKIFEDAVSNPPVPSQKELIDLDSNLEKMEGELRDVCTNAQTLERNYLELVDMRHVLAYVQLHTEVPVEAIEATSSAAPAGGEDVSDGSDTKAIMSSGEQAGVPEISLASLHYIAGVISREKVATFERMLWRIARGNIYMRHAEVIQIQGEAPTANIAELTENQPPKDVFIAFFQGEHLKSKINKVCDAFHATIHNFPGSVTERLRVKAGIEARVADLVAVLSQTDEHRNRLLLQAASKLRTWQSQISKVKAIFHELNKFNVDVSNKCLLGDGWCPTDEIERVRQALTHASDLSGSSVPSFLQVRETTAAPPTFFRHNKFTAAFQSIVHSYGVADYREVNPALYTTITFPFLFAVMFGDLGHGIIMFLAGLYLVMKEHVLIKEARRNESFAMFFGGRYIILLMGAFSMYTGLIYNDVFSKSIKILPTSWYIDPNMTVIIDYSPGKKTDSSVLMLEPANKTNWKTIYDEPYGFGLDPVWNGAVNEIMFTDSMKMKMSVVLGVTQMLFGLILGVFNHVFFGKYLNIFCEFIPMLLFMSCIFVYMDLLIIWKWISITPENSQCAPSILIGVLNMILQGDTPGCSGEIFRELKPLQVCLLLIAVFSIPWLLLAKPIVLWRRAVAKEKAAAASAGLLAGGGYVPPKLAKPEGGSEFNVSTESIHDNGNLVELADKPGTSVASVKRPEPVSHEQHHEKFEFSEEFIHQAIHTIEYCLGLVSHTASYLRLWALSLAHVELSQVLWMYLMKMAFGFGSSFLGAIISVPLFAAWAALTISILVLMEGLSAFLHALRLHWVEFQSKFYGGSGYAFMPFSFSESEDDETMSD